MTSNDDQMLPLRCPRCGHEEAKLFLHSATVATVKCADCANSWSVDIGVLPEEVRQRISPAAIDRLRVKRSA
jgi:transcription elongation factor Elf1